VFDLLLFDLDGTLVDTRQDIAEAVNHALELHGRPAVPLETVISWVGDGLDDMMSRAFRTDDASMVAQLVEEFRVEYKAHCTDFSRPYRDCATTLSALRRHGKRLSVLTNKPQDLSLEIFRRLELLQYFDHVVGPSEPALRKPNPSNLLWLARDAGVSPDRTLMIGDSKNDILVAHNAGVASCGCTFGYIGRAGLLHYQPTFLIDDWPALLKLADRQD